MDCEGPTTARDVATAAPADKLDFSQLFWHCAPGGDGAKGHIMTGVEHDGYNIAWFSPKPVFSAVSQGVLGHQRDVDVSPQVDAGCVRARMQTRALPGRSVGTASAGVLSQTRGTGGFDLGYTIAGLPQTRIAERRASSREGTLAGFKTCTVGELVPESGSWMTQFVGPTANLTGSRRPTRRPGTSTA